MSGGQGEGWAPWCRPPVHPMKLPWVDRVAGPHRWRLQRLRCGVTEGGTVLSRRPGDAVVTPTLPNHLLSSLAALSEAQRAAPSALGRFERPCRPAVFEDRRRPSSAIASTSIATYRTPTTAGWGTFMPPVTHFSTADPRGSNAHHVEAHARRPRDTVRAAAAPRSRSRCPRAPPVRREGLDVYRGDRCPHCRCRRSTPGRSSVRVKSPSQLSATAFRSRHPPTPASMIVLAPGPPRTRRRRRRRSWSRCPLRQSAGRSRSRSSACRCRRRRRGPRMAREHRGVDRVAARPSGQACRFDAGQSVVALRPDGQCRVGEGEIRVAGLDDRVRSRPPPSGCQRPGPPV